MNSTAIRALSQTLDGDVITLEDAGYDEARTLFNSMIDRRPAAIAYCTTVDAVIAAVEAARTSEAELAVRAGGHSVAGASLCDGGLVIDVRRMNDVVVDPQARTARTGRARSGPSSMLRHRRMDSRRPEAGSRRPA